MNIVVCVKFVPDSTADQAFESDNTVDRQGVPGLLSELDEYAVEQALQLKEKPPSGDGGDEVEVTALTVGPADGRRQGHPRRRRRERRLGLPRHLAGTRRRHPEDR